MEELNQDGNQEPNQGQNQNSNESDWKVGITDEALRDDPSLASFKDVTSLAKSYVQNKADTSVLVNSKGLIVPGEGATDEEKNTFYNSLGRPETVDGYELPVPELPKGMEYNAERTKMFAEIAHSKGVSKDAFQAIVNAYNEDEKTRFEGYQTEQNNIREQSTVAMKKEWGANYEANLAKADAVIVPLFGEEFRQKLIDTGLNMEPAIINGLFKVSQAVGEHALKTGTPAAGGETYTMEKLISMKMDPRYCDPGKRDPAFIKEVEAYNESYSEQLGAIS